MAIISFDVRGLGDVNMTMPTVQLTSQAMAAQVAAMRRVSEQSGLHLYERLNIMPQTTTTAAGSFIDQWGIPIAAGLGAFTVGLVIAKLARKRKTA